MKAMVFDAGPLISLAMNNLLWLLEPLKKEFKGEFHISAAVKKEVVDKPLSTKRFKFEAIQIQRYISSGVLKVLKNEATKEKTVKMLDLANHCFSAKGNPIRIVHYGEMASLVAALSLNASAVVIDERTTRKLIEEPEKLAEIMKKRLHTSIETNKESLQTIMNEIKGIRVIRSVELVTIAYEKGLFEGFIQTEKDAIPNIKKTLLESLLWGLKLDGCAISNKDISAIMKLERV